MAEATSTAETLHRHGDPDPSKWDEAEAKTDRENDLGYRENEWAQPNSTIASRARARQGARTKAVTEAENKAVSTSTTKGRRRGA